MTMSKTTTMSPPRSGDAAGLFGDAASPSGDAPVVALTTSKRPARPRNSVPKTGVQRPQKADQRPHPKGTNSAKGRLKVSDPPVAGDAGDASFPRIECEESERGSGADPGHIQIGRETPSPSAPASPPDASRGAPPPPATAPAESASGEGKDPKLAEAVVQIVTAQAELFHDARGDAYATILDVKGATRTTRLDGSAMRAWIAHMARKALGESVAPTTIDEARLALTGIALYDGPEIPVHVRVAEHDGCIYYDLGDETGDVVVARPRGWEIVRTAPVRFVRPSGLRPLPRPVVGGSVEELRPLVNLDPDDFILLVAWLVAALRPGRPFCILALQGEQGTAKSTAARVARRLIDPSVLDLRSPPRTEDDLLVAAHNSHVVAIDNLSGLQAWLSDALCRIATGGGISKRAHYSNADETIVDALRPQVLNGIDDIAARADLAERSIVLTLEPITKRRDEAAFWADFQKRAPRILGALLDAVCCALANVDKTTVRDLPRMADFARWVTAAEPALSLPRGTILGHYRKNLGAAAAVALEASPVAVAVRALVDARRTWGGTADQLLTALLPHTTAEVTLSRAWPKDGARLSGRLRRDAVPLRTAGVEIAFTTHGRGVDKKRWITLAKAAPQGKTP